jgi:WD40 repeat protein
MKDQKHLIVLLVITVALASFLGGYILTQPAKSSDSVLQQQRGVLIDRFNGVDSSTTPTPLPPGMLQATSDTVLAATGAPDSDAVLYYHPESGSVSMLDLESRRNNLISTTSLPRLVNVLWSPNKNRVITIARGAGGLTYSYFDYTTHEHGSLGAGIKDIVFSPDSKQLGLVKNFGGDTVIQTADFNGANPQTILKTRLDGIKLSWPSSTMLSFIALDTDTKFQSLYTLSMNGDLSQPLESQSNLAVRWSPNGSMVLYSEGDGELHVFEIPSQQSRPLTVQASARTCSWTSDDTSVICAENNGETSIIKINIATGTPTTLFSHLIISPQDAFLSQSGNFFVLTGADQSLWEVRL